MEGEFGHVLGLGERFREVIQVLEAVIMCPMHWERRSFRLLIKVYEASGSRLKLRLVERIHRAELCRVYPMVMKGLLALLVTG